MSVKVQWCMFYEAHVSKYMSFFLEIGKPEADTTSHIYVLMVMSLVDGVYYKVGYTEGVVCASESEGLLHVVYKNFGKCVIMMQLSPRFAFVHLLTNHLKPSNNTI